MSGTWVVLDELVVVAVHVVFPQEVINTEVKQVLLDDVFQLCNTTATGHVTLCLALVICQNDAGSLDTKYGAVNHHVVIH